MRGVSVQKIAHSDRHARYGRDGAVSRWAERGLTRNWRSLRFDDLTHPPCPHRQASIITPALPLSEAEIAPPLPSAVTGAPTCPKPSVRASAPLCPARHSIIKALSIASVVVRRSREPGLVSFSHRFAPLKGANPNSKAGPLFRLQSTKGKPIPCV